MMRACVRKCELVIRMFLFVYACACVRNNRHLSKGQGVTAAFWILVVVVLAVVDAVTESHDRYTLEAFPATPGIWPTPFVRVCNIRNSNY